MPEPLSPAVQYLIADNKKLEEARFEFAKEHGFAFKRPEHFKDCVVIRFPHRRRTDPDFVDHQRINEYVDFMHSVEEHFKLHDEKHPLLDSDLMLIKAGIYSFYSWRKKVWAIPNSNAEVKAFVLANLPKWATVTEKA